MQLAALATAEFLIRMSGRFIPEYSTVRCCVFFFHWALRCGLHACHKHLPWSVAGLPILNWLIVSRSYPIVCRDV